ncbi:MAG: type II toxin-antitoxin system VapC family toxin [Candidatus Riflebacteria bacterium]|nr:type II toxin-antitoxin system VapC family toxin [Candidatus Riflebacteria bacterium]
MNKFSIDTNVLIYSIDQESKYHEEASKFLNSNFDFFVSSKSLSEFYSVVTRAPISSLSISDALKMMIWFSNNFKILFPNQSSMSILFDLTEKYNPKGLKIHDFEIVSIGLANKITRFATFNSKDFIEIKEIEVFDLKTKQLYNK